jgi:hypothetical protein
VITERLWRLCESLGRGTVHETMGTDDAVRMGREAVRMGMETVRVRREPVKMGRMEMGRRL